MMFDNDALRLLVYVLAGYRLVVFLHYDHGPFSLMDWVRFKAGVFAYDVEVDGKETIVRDSMNDHLGALFNCPSCLAFWVAVPLACFWVWNVWQLEVVMLILGLWGAITFLMEKSELRV